MIWIVCLAGALGFSALVILGCAWLAARADEQHDEAAGLVVEETRRWSGGRIRRGNRIVAMINPAASADDVAELRERLEGKG